VGALLLALVLWFSWSEMRFAAAAEPTPSRVIEAPRGGGDDPAQSYGRIAFAHRGQRHVLTMEPGSGSGTLPQDTIVGDWQTLLVPPGEPERARIADFANRYALKFVIFFFGAIMLLGGMMLRLFAAPLSDSGSSTRRVALGFLAIGLCLLTIAAGATLVQKRWADRSIESIGVAEYRENRVRVRVTDRQRRIWHARAPFLPDSLPLGRDYVTVPIRYDPDRPWDIGPYGARQLYSTHLFLGGFALAFCSIPLLGLWIMWRSDRRRERERR